MKRRIRYMALLLVLCMLVLTGCAQPRDTMTLRVCLDAAPATLDPAMASSDAERTVVAHLFENLMKLSRGEDGGIPLVRRADRHRPRLCLCLAAAGGPGHRLPPRGSAEHGGGL